MIPTQQKSRRFNQPVAHRGLSLVETVLSIVLVSGLLVAALQTTGSAAMANAQSAQRSVGFMLGSALLNEILQTNYKEPDVAVLFGLEAGDVDLDFGTRTNWDDVDDYHNLNETTVERKGGKDYSDRANWQRTVRVEFVRRADIAQTTASDEGLKRVTVTVRYDSAVTAVLTAVISDTVQSITKVKKPLIVEGLELELEVLLSL